MNVYPCGYAGYPELIGHLMWENQRLIMIDTRFKPWSNMPEWRGEQLRAIYGERYRWAGQSLGNFNYRRGGPIRLADPATGLRGLRHWLQHGYDLLLLCGCAVYDRCHLRTIVTMLTAQMPEVNIILPEQFPNPGRRKCLSVRQPWAWLLTHPEEVAACGLESKSIENRDWCPRYRGPLLLHASATIETAFFDRRSGLLLPDYWTWKFGDAGARLACVLPQHRGEYVTGAIVGVAELVDVMDKSESPWFTGSYGLVLTDARAITPPISYAGRRMLFEVPADSRIDEIFHTPSAGMQTLPVVESERS